MFLANLTMCSETHSGIIGKICWVSLCARPPGGCLGASGPAGEVAIEPLPACLPGRSMFQLCHQSAVHSGQDSAFFESQFSQL